MSVPLAPRRVSKPRNAISPSACASGQMRETWPRAPLAPTSERSGKRARAICRSGSWPGSSFSACHGSRVPSSGRIFHLSPSSAFWGPLSTPRSALKRASSEPSRTVPPTPRAARWLPSLMPVSPRTPRNFVVGVGDAGADRTCGVESRLLVGYAGADSGSFRHRNARCARIRYRQ